MFSTVLTPILALLAAGSRPLATPQDLRAAVAAAGRSNLALGGSDDAFTVNPVDWARLSLADGVARFDDMRQSDDHTCLLNAVRFVLQRKHDVMLGVRPHGDRIVWALVRDYVPEAHFAGAYADAGSKSLQVAVGWLAALGIPAGRPVLVTSIAAYVRQRLAEAGAPFHLFVSGRSNSVDHTYVIYGTRSTPARLDYAVYDPWTGKVLDARVETGVAADLIEADAFQMNFALPLSATGDKIIPPGDETHYSVLLVGR